MDEQFGDTVTRHATEDSPFPDSGDIDDASVAVTDSLRGVARAYGRGIHDRRRGLGAWDDTLSKDHTPELTQDFVQGQGMLGDTRILIVDDCTLYRESLAGEMAALGAINPGIAWDFTSLIAAVEKTRPRVVLLNLATRDSSVLLRHALTLNRNLRVIVLGITEDDESEIVACAEAGVAGYHLRTESIEDLLVLIRKVAAGESLVSPRVSAILLRRLSVLASQRQPADQDLVLTGREAQILKMLELGLSNRDIAEQLCIAVHTVKNHVHSLLTKLGVDNRAQAAALSRTLRYAEGGSRD